MAFSLNQQHGDSAMPWADMKDPRKESKMDTWESRVWEDTVLYLKEPEFEMRHSPTLGRPTLREKAALTSGGQVWQEDRPSSGASPVAQW